MLTNDARLHDESRRQAERDLAVRFRLVAEQADLAARAASPGRRAGAYAKVMCDNGFAELDMDEVRRLVGD